MKASRLLAIVASTALAAASMAMGAEPAPIAATTAQSAQTPTVKTVICFRTSLRCFTTVPTTPTALGRSKGSSAPMDLSAPSIARIFPQAALQEKLPEPEVDIHEPQETVQVEGRRRLAPRSVGIMAIPWAIRHPTQAWRIFMPLPPEDGK